MVKKRVFKGYRGENRCILGEYRCILEKTGVYSFIQVEYWCILVYKGVYTSIKVKKPRIQGYLGENRCILGGYGCIWKKTGVYSFMEDEYWCILVY